jgi:hypothetical protein
MSIPVKLAAYAAAIALVVLGAFAVGAAVGPLSPAGAGGPMDAPSRAARVDGYTVELAGDLLPGRASPVTLTVTRDGQPVTDLQPYLGAYGHLVALREGDLAYLHVHPEGIAGSGPQVRFVAEVPSTGTYRLFLNFQHGGAEHTADFTVTTGPAAPAHGH